MNKEIIFVNGPVLVTGASGVLGGAILDALSSAGVVVRQGLRNPEKARAGMQSVRFDYTDSTTFVPALNGIHGLVLMAPPLDGDAPAKLGPVIAAAKNMGVEHIVLISAFGVNHNEQAPLRVVEHLVIDSGVPYTILRPNFFMENLSQGSVAGTIKGQNGIFVSAADGKTSFISVRDIAASVVAALQTPMLGREFDLTGPEALDHAEVAKVIADVSGRPVVYHALTEEQMIAGLRAHGMPDSAISYLAVLYSVVRAGYAAGITSDVETITRRKPMDFKTFAELVATEWK
jgi:uncharacterized protein YbjT (DUF2867 family)